MSTTTAPKAIKPDDTVTTIEAIERGLPLSQAELCTKRSHIEGQLKHAEAQVTAAEQSRLSTAASEAARWRGAIGKHRAELGALERFDAATRRDAILKFVVHAPELLAMNEKTSARYALLVDSQFNHALSSTEFQELKSLDQQRSRVTNLLRKVQELTSELRDLVPAHIAQERQVLQALNRALADIAPGGVAGTAAASVRAWASGELARLSEAITSQTWAELERFELQSY